MAETHEIQVNREDAQEKMINIVLLFNFTNYERKVVEQKPHKGKTTL